MISVFINKQNIVSACMILSADCSSPIPPYVLIILFVLFISTGEYTRGTVDNQIALFSIVQHQVFSKVHVQ